MRKLTNSEFKSVFGKVPRVTINLVVKDRRGVLLIKRSLKPDMGRWHLPGGTLYYKERIRHAVHRKAKEETGLKIKVKRFLGIYEIMGRMKEPGYAHCVDLAFLCIPVSGKLKGDRRYGGDELHFFKKLPANVPPEHRDIVKGRFMLQ